MLGFDIFSVVNCNPNADAKTAPMALVVDWCAHLINDAVSEERQLLGIVICGAKDDELVTSNSSNEASIADLGSEDIRCMNQHRITCGMAKRIIDMFEPV
jgi:hypothetical protein